MPKFALAYPYFIIMLCLVVAVVGVATVARMPVDLFPQINIPVVVVATFYSGMPPQQIEADITNTFERFFTLGSNIDHIESRSLTGVSLIKIYFKPGTNANAALSNIANLAMADLRRLPPGTLPPVVLKFDASSLPVCLITLQGKRSERNAAQRSGAIPSSESGRQRARRLGATAIWRNVPADSGVRRSREAGGPPTEPHGCGQRRSTSSNLILPAGDVRIGNRDYNIYANSQVPEPAERSITFRSRASASARCWWPTSEKPKTAGAIQTNIVRIDGQRSVYIPVLKQGGDSNTIAIVNGSRKPSSTSSTSRTC